MTWMSKSARYAILAMECTSRRPRILAQPRELNLLFLERGWERGERTLNSLSKH
jgi:hypothetical protein